MRARHLTLIVLAAHLLAGAGTSARADWPHPRGPGQDGRVAPGETVPAALPDDPRVLWRVEATDGFAAPIISGGRVYYGDYRQGKEVFHALELAGGEPVWQDVLDRPHRDGFGTGPRCAPVSDGKIVLTQSCRGELHCLDAATGKLLWEKNYLEDFGAPYIGEKGSAAGASRHGYAATPCIEGDHVITLAGGPGAAVVCLEKATGEVVWQSQDDLAAYAPPRVATLAGVEQVVCFTVNGALGLDRGTGEALWRVPMETAYGRHVAAPAIHGDLVIFGSHEGGLVAARVIRREGRVTTEEAWRLSAEQAPNFASPLLAGDHLYLLAGNEVLCLEASTGREAWRQAGLVQTTPARAFAAFMGMGDNILMLTDMGELILFRADPAAYRELGRTQVCGKNWCHPAYSGGRLVVRDGRRLACIELLPAS